MKNKDIEIRRLRQDLPGIEIMPVTGDEHTGDLGVNLARPHRHDHYFCFLLESGRMSGAIDFHDVELDQPALVLSCPGQVHNFRQAENLIGWTIAFDAKYIDQSARMVIENSFANIALILLNNVDIEWFVQIFRLLSTAVNDNKAAQFQQELVQALLNAVFYKTVNIFQFQENERIQAASARSVEIVKLFNLLVKEHFHTLKRPAEYASQMNITVSYLNDTVKSITGFSSTRLIRQEIMSEAQRLLVYTAKSVMEIALQLGYEDHKYFIRLFSKSVGISPATFRKRSSVSFYSASAGMS